MKMRVLVTKSALAAHLSEEVPMSQNLWVCLQMITVLLLINNQAVGCL